MAKLSRISALSGTDTRSTGILNISPVPDAIYLTIKTNRLRNTFPVYESTSRARGPRTAAQASCREVHGTKPTDGTKEGGTADQSTKVNILINSEEEGGTVDQRTKANTLTTSLTGEVAEQSSIDDTQEKQDDKSAKQAYMTKM